VLTMAGRGCGRRVDSQPLAIMGGPTKSATTARGWRGISLDSYITQY